jgi:hypothetical protein
MAATKRLRAAVATIRQSKERTVFFDMSFSRIFDGTGLSWEQAEKTTKVVSDAFDLWWNSWIEPELKVIEKG